MAIIGECRNCGSASRWNNEEDMNSCPRCKGIPRLKYALEPILYMLFILTVIGLGIFGIIHEIIKALTAA